MNPALEVRPSFRPLDHARPPSPWSPRGSRLRRSNLASRSPAAFPRHPRRSSLSPRRSAQEDEDAAEKFSLELEMKQLGELQESRNELLSRVSNLKRDLQDWRFKLDNQVKSYRSELRPSQDAEHRGRRAGRSFRPARDPEAAVGGDRGDRG